MRAFVWVALVVPWVLAALAWPDLPERVPLHFDVGGRVDRWGATSWWGWFGLPVLATSIGALTAFVLPRWMVGLARRNSRWLNMPHKAQFAALSVAARERVVLAAVAWLRVLTCCHQGMFAYLVFGSARVADRRWAVLPTAPLFVLLALLLACVVGLSLASSKAVRREAAAAAR